MSHLRISGKKHGGNAPMILCDTNIIIEALKNNPVVIRTIEKIGLERIAVSVVTVMELYYGALHKAELKKIKRHLSSIRILQIDEAISVAASELIERYAKSHGLQIPDALIAATSINHGLKLYTGNKKDFIYIENVSLWAI
ncbi:MAG: type II toxin-antitoxin system VapC family toxin [Syntrophobacterales bacterium]|nr:type II toxin-antitoxin system VapC family toxin [Syntrophobacterales bacterium]